MSSSSSEALMPRTSEMGPRLSTNRSVCTSIFCNIVSMRLLRRAFSSFGLAAEAAPLVVVEFVGVAFREVVIDVLAVLQAEAAAAGEQDGQVAVRVAVAVAHAAAEQHHRAVEQRLAAVQLALELVEEVARTAA